LQLPFCYVSPQNLYASLLKLSAPMRALFCYIQCSRFLKNIRIVKVGSKNNLKLKQERGEKMEERIQNSHSIHKSKKV